MTRRFPGGTEITTRYLFPNNDFIQIYAQTQDNGLYRLTDDHAVYGELMLDGLTEDQIANRISSMAQRHVQIQCDEYAGEMFVSDVPSNRLLSLARLLAKVMAETANHADWRVG